MRLSPGQWLYHQPTRLVVELLAHDENSYSVQPIGNRTELQWTPGLVEKECRPIARNGFRAAEFNDLDRLQNWLREPGKALLIAMLRDEQARGEPGLRRRYVRAYLEPHIRSESLDDIVERLGSLMDTAPVFGKQGEGHNLVYVLNDDEAPLEASLGERLMALDLWPSSTCKRLTLPAAIDRVENFLEEWKDSPAHAVAAAQLGRLVSGGEGIFPTGLLERATQALVPGARDGAAWKAFRSVNRDAQLAVLRSTVDGTVHRIAAWHPSVHRDARAHSVAFCTSKPKLFERLQKAVLPGSPSVEDRLRALDEAIACAPRHHAPQLARMAFRQLARIRPGSVEVPPLPAMMSLVNVSPTGVLLDWLSQAIADGVRPANALEWADRFAAAAGVPKTDLEAAINAVAVGSFLLAPRDAFAGPLADYYDEHSAGIEQLLDNGYRRVRGVQTSREELERLASAALDPEATAVKAAMAADRYVEMARECRAREHLEATVLRAIETSTAHRIERDEANKKAADPDHARRVLEVEQESLVLQDRESLKADVERDQAEHTQALIKRSATTLAEIITAVQTIQKALEAQDDAHQKLLSLEKRLLALTRRWHWEPIGRAWEPVTPDAKLHDISGEGDSAPVVVTVGIRTVQQRGGDVVIKAKAVRRQR